MEAISVGDSLDELLRKAADMTRALAPDDLRGLPVYIIAKSRLPREFAALEQFGWTSPILDTVLQPHIRQWQGRGPAMVVCDDRIRATVDAAEAADVARFLFVRQFITTAIHEAAHVLERAFPYGPVMPETDVPQMSVRMIEALSGPAYSGPKSPVPYNMHEWPFIRVCSHLAYRAQQMEVGWLDSPALAAGETYSLSPFSAYVAALGDEPERMRDASFADIRATAPPPEFQELWQRDVATFAENQSAAQV